MSLPSERIFVGVARLVLSIGGARSLKDRRQAVRSFRDRMRHRYPVTCHEVGIGALPTRQVVVLTTAGNDQRLLRSILDSAVAWAMGSGRVNVSAVDVDVFRWHPSDSEFTDLLESATLEDDFE